MFRPWSGLAAGFAVGASLTACTTQNPQPPAPPVADVPVQAQARTGEAPLKCRPDPVDPAGQPRGSGWGLDLENTRFQTARDAGISRNFVGTLDLAWAVQTTPEADSSQPAVIGDTVFVSKPGGVAALDLATGCSRWRGSYGAAATSGFANFSSGHGDAPRLYFGDALGRVVAVNRLTGSLLWAVELGSAAPSGSVATPVRLDDVLYAATASKDAGSGGALHALSAQTGEVIWKVSDQSNFRGAATSFYASPALDAERRLAYATTGPGETELSNTIVAVELDSGTIRWRVSLGERGFNVPPVLIRAEEGDILVAQSNSGLVMGLDPSNGHWVWERQLGSGRALMPPAGMAASGDTLFVPSADPSAAGLFAFDAYTGELRWQFRTPAGISKTVVAFPGAVAASYRDGFIRIHDSNGGRVFHQMKDPIGPKNSISSVGPLVAGGALILSGSSQVAVVQP